MRMLHTLDKYLTAEKHTLQCYEFPVAQKELFTIEMSLFSLFRETVIKNLCKEARKKKVEEIERHRKRNHSFSYTSPIAQNSSARTSHFSPTLIHSLLPQKSFFNTVEHSNMVSMFWLQSSCAPESVCCGCHCCRRETEAWRKVPLLW